MATANQSSISPRIKSALRTAQQWEEDVSLLKEIRDSLLPLLEELCPEFCLGREYAAFLNGGGVDEQANDDEDSKAAAAHARMNLKRPDDTSYTGDDLLLKRLTLYFKREIMTWVNSPPCVNPTCKGNEDGKQMKSLGVRGPESENEIAGGAGRVEMYQCTLCQTPTTFPRYNSPRALYTSRRGRCGEYANLFGVYCRALGFDTRYCLDFTDHVWTEVWSVRMGKWVHADSCEGLIDRPGMYEKGWGKKLSYVIGATHDHVTDISKRYTRQFHTTEFQTRRRQYSPDEDTSNRQFVNINTLHRQSVKIPKSRVDELDKREREENKFFNVVQVSGVWDEEYTEGRISGSYEWKRVRGELGEGKVNQSEKKEEVKEASFVVESFYPTPHQQSVLNVSVGHPSKKHKCIVVNGVGCAAILESGTSIVVIDELSGCILQSRAFSSWSSVGEFVDTVPDGRVVALVSNVGCVDETSANQLKRIGGLEVNSQSSDATLFVGQVGYKPNLSTCINTTDATKTVNVSIQLDVPSSLQVRLRSEVNCTPAAVSTRLPESIMPLKTQIVASEYQKRVAFEAFMKNSEGNSTVVGYTTRPEAPIYLIGNEAYPMSKSGGNSHDGTNKSSWVTYHYLPDVLVPDDDVITETKESEKSTKYSSEKALFDIPVANEYFMGLLGGDLLTKTGSSPPSLTHTNIAIENTRLVAFYFSAHWCGPCRRFTPMLIEFYHHLKEVAPSHGLEIIFVSSDRNESEFNQYYQTMPFKAIPFANRSMAQQLKSVFGVNGIPSFVVMDSLSGRIVASQQESRGEVHGACSMGEEAIERLFQSWLDKVPEESKAMLDILTLSCEEAKESGDSSERNGDATKQNAKANEYLVRKKSADSPEDPSVFVKKVFTELVANGMRPNEAAAEAIKRSTNQSISLSEGALQGAIDSNGSLEANSNPIKKAAEAMLELNQNDKTTIKNALTIAKKYVCNVSKSPFNPRFRAFRLSNSVFDQITSVQGSIQLLTCIGFAVFPSDVDFMATIPLAADLNRLEEVLDKLIEIFGA